jgi:hypothetical protein
MRSFIKDHFFGFTSLPSTTVAVMLAATKTPPTSGRPTGARRRPFEVAGAPLWFQFCLSSAGATGRFFIIGDVALQQSRELRSNGAEKRKCPKVLRGVYQVGLGQLARLQRYSKMPATSGSSPSQVSRTNGWSWQSPENIFPTGDDGRRRAGRCARFPPCSFYLPVGQTGLMLVLWGFAHRAKRTLASDGTLGGKGER